MSDEPKTAMDIASKYGVTIHENDEPNYDPDGVYTAYDLATDIRRIIKEQEGKGDKFDLVQAIEYMLQTYGIEDQTLED